MNFNELKLEDAHSLIEHWKSPLETTNLLFLSGDHWQKGDGWIGPDPDDGDLGAVSKFKALLEREFCFHDVLSEIVWRAAKAVTARPPRYGAHLVRALKENEKPTPDEEKTRGAMDDAALAWAEDENRFVWTDEQGRLQAGSLKPFLFRMEAQLASSGRVVLRAFIPPAHLVDVITETRSGDGALTQTQSKELKQVALWDSWKRIHIELCPLESACVEVQRDAMAPVGVVLWNKAEQGFAEICFVGKDEKTVLVKIGEKETLKESFDLGGALLHLQLCAQPLLKPSLIAQQKDINRRLTMSGRSSNLAGFPGRVLIDGDLDGEEIEVPSNVPGGAPRKRFIPDPINIGSGQLNNFKSEIIETEAGEYLGTKQAQYIRDDPVDTTIFDKSIDAARARMLGEAHQSHALIAGDATASGVSRQQAAHEFRLSLSELVTSGTRAILWAFNTSFALAKETSDGKDTASVAGFEWTGEVVVDDGARTSEDRGRDAQDVKDGLLSRETAMARGGIDDIDAEFDRIEGERTPATAFQVGSTEERASLSKSLREDGVDDATRWEKVWGFDAEQIKKMSDAKKNALFGDGWVPAPETPLTAVHNARGSVTPPLYKIGDAVQATTDHMKGMMEMMGRVAIVREGAPPYYGIKFDGMGEIHKWMAEDELKPAAPMKM
jgi:hypothetical protein